MPYDYFYNGEAEQYIHYTLPKPFFKKISDKEATGYENEELTGLSLNAKFLYSILLDKAKLSDKNGFTDENGKVCVYYPQAKMAKLLHVERKQLYKYLNELDVKSGIGLIERKQKLGKGRTDCIYVKNFAKPIRDSQMSASTYDTKYKYFCDDDTASAARFNYYPLPKALFYDVDYAEKVPYSDEVMELQKLPSNAKMAYTYFLDLLPLSISKGKKDEYGRYYVICPEKDLQKLLGCCEKTVRQILNQLDINGGVGLIERSADNPAMIYVLDYSARLRLSGKSNDKKSTHQNEKSTHQKKESTHQQGEKSTHQNKKSTHQNEKNTHQNEKNTHQNEKSTHPIYNNPYFNNPDFIDNHSINPANDTECVNENSDEMIDRLTDITADIKKEISPFEILTVLGYDGYIPEDESYFEDWCMDIDNRIIATLAIPYTLHSNTMAMREALKFLFCYNRCCYDEYNPDYAKKTKILLDKVIECLCEMLKDEYYVLNKKTGEKVWHYQIIDVLNDIIHNSSLEEWLINTFLTEWSQILSERMKSMGNNVAYMKSCIWNSLKDFRFNENNIELMIDNDFPVTSISSNNGKNLQCQETDSCTLSADIYHANGVNIDNPTDLSDKDVREAGKSSNCPLSNASTLGKNETVSETVPQKTDCKIKLPDDFIVTFWLKAAVENNRSLRSYVGDDYSYPLPNGLTLDSPADLTYEKLRELEELYDVRLQKQENKKTKISDNSIITFWLLTAIENNKSLRNYIGEDYSYPLPDGLTLDSPADLTYEKLNELEELYNVRLRKQENAWHNS